MSTIALTACFAVWTIFSIVGIRIKQDLGLNDAAFGLLVGTPILTGSIVRIPLGIWTDQIGGRRLNLLVMLLAALATFLLSHAQTYVQMLLAAAGVGLAGGGFSISVAYLSKFYGNAKQGAVLGVLGAGNVGAAVTQFAAPLVMLAFGWRAVAQDWAVALAAIAILVFLTSRDDAGSIARRAGGARAQTAPMRLEPLRSLQVWRFALYYLFVYGAFVALALWLPLYLAGVYRLNIAAAGALAAAFTIPGSLFRIFGGWLSDRIGARQVMYFSFGVSVLCTFLLSYPSTTYIIDGSNGPITFRLAIGLVPCAMLLFCLGFAMGLGNAAVYKHIPAYYPDHVGLVGGMVGTIGGLGGFILPLAFGALSDATHVASSCFMLLFVLVGAGLIWMHLAIRRMELRQTPELSRLPELPEMASLHPDLALGDGLDTSPG
jgi:NNP family nitrate/nitrite transporter-like MFS transporter